ncbi:hypothetical protein [Bathymodiolus thermophilus thioautotrophic gill symbiont]|uniref:Uncharacterized protein n=1 Tax=Bathymodiolus thermophilus thioautotrophic gill symbiont TaxID=2360 RepID=A0A1J5UN91_9GAMM|nr:hypothetical protein [Bathymodiolus thermophilus thioautotrophic gill symbiont]OIR25695.1 hypothetical protein BGC33_07565 [Bathymodiolus thermophilus thioautotrophic gill symbiont]
MLEEILRGDTNLVVFFSFAIVTYASLLYVLLQRVKNRKENQQKRFIKLLSNGIKKEMVVTFEDVEDIYKGVCKINNSNTETDKSKLARWLREFLLDLLEKPKENEFDNYLEIKTCIAVFIKKAEAESPHSNLPELERNIIRDIENYINSQNTEYAKQKLNELIAAIQIRDESIKKLQGIAKWSIPLSIVGLILTFIFGILSFVK